MKPLLAPAAIDSASSAIAVLPVELSEKNRGFILVRSAQRDQERLPDTKVFLEPPPCGDHVEDWVVSGILHPSEAMWNVTESDR